MNFKSQKFFLQLLKLFFLPIKILLEFFLKKKKIIILFRRGNTLGDNVVITGIINQLVKKIDKKIVLFTKFPEIFYNNKKIYKTYDIKNKKIFPIILKLLEGNCICEMHLDFGNYNDIMDKLRIENTPKENRKVKIHISQCLAGKFNKNIDVKNLKNEFFFTEEEKTKYEKKYESLINKKFIIVQPFSQSGFSKIRSWNFNKYQKLIDIYKLNWVQVGLKDEKILNGVVNLLGKTNIRELFFLVYKCNFILSNDGALNHIANCFDKKSFVIMSGYTHEEFIKYNNTTLISRVPQIECAPCYLKTECPKERKFCTDDISVEDVLKTINKKN